jgi:hypothetical protein
VDQDMAPIAIVEHRLPGRARLRIPSKRGEIPWFASLVRQLARHPEIDELRANPRTGSILIHHQDPLDLLELLATESSLIEIAASSPEDMHQDVPQTGALAPVSGFLNTTAAGLGILAIYQATRGRAVGTALEHFWSAYGSVRTLGSPTLAVGFAGLGLYQLMRGQLMGPAASLAYYALITRHIAEGHDKGGALTASEVRPDSPSRI